MITSIRSPSQNAIVFVVAARMNVRQLAQIPCRPTNYGSILAFLAPTRSARTRRHASPCAIAPPLAAHWHARGALTA